MILRATPRINQDFMIHQSKLPEKSSLKPDADAIITNATKIPMNKASIMIFPNTSILSIKGRELKSHIIIITQNGG